MNVIVVNNSGSQYVVPISILWYYVNKLQYQVTGVGTVSRPTLYCTLVSYHRNCIVMYFYLFIGRAT